MTRHAFTAVFPDGAIAWVRTVSDSIAADGALVLATGKDDLVRLGP